MINDDHMTIDRLISSLWFKHHLPELREIEIDILKLFLPEVVQAVDQEVYGASLPFEESPVQPPHQQVHGEVFTGHKVYQGVELTSLLVS